ncbi:hypothetical protein [Colwellia psychrerythraea]|uniref:PEP motif anchor domain protein n=1 Tax=Colwellia psychrerythraea TaxID=28229 RepID=A0A099KN44_COLPS|nr:hypothetical protein [Colwellia psychrerythraea]KGJ91906.1 hypothetical protein GAB14E_3063 [Colwellia psychrerythraea]
MLKTNKIKLLSYKGLFTIAATCVMSFSVQANLMTGYLTLVDTTTAECSSYCTNYSSTFDGGEMQASAESTINGSGSSASALSDLTGSTYLPNLKVKSTASANYSGVANAYAVQRYKYTGPSYKTISINLNLHGSSMENTANDETYISSNTGIVMGAELDYYPNFDLLYELGTEFAAVASMRIRNGIDVNEAGVLNFDVNPGDIFFVISDMKATAQDGYSDAWNTLTMNFTDPTNLVAASAPTGPVPSIPEPKIILLFVFALFSLNMRRLNKAK